MCGLIAAFPAAPLADAARYVLPADPRLALGQLESMTYLRNQAPRNPPPEAIITRRKTGFGILVARWGWPRRGWVG